MTDAPRRSEVPAEIRIGDLPAAAHVPDTAQFEIPEIPRSVLGWRVFRWLIWASAVAVGVLIVVGWATYPSRPYSGTPTSDAYQLWSTARSEWFNNMKDLGQLLLITPLVSLISATIGYMFGSQPQT